MFDNKVIDKPRVRILKIVVIVGIVGKAVFLAGVKHGGKVDSSRESLFFVFVGFGVVVFIVVVVVVVGRFQDVDGNHLVQKQFEDLGLENEM
jgi:hypothetical protein